MAQHWMMGAGLFLALGMAACGERGAEAATDSGTAASAAQPEAAFEWADMAALRAVRTPAVRAYLADLDETCASADFSDQGIAQTDFNADGQPDFLLYLPNLICGGEPVGNMYCGSGGCSHDLLVSSGDDYLLRSIQSVDVEIISHDGRPAVREPLDGSEVRLLAWDGTQMAEIETEQSQARGNDEGDIRRVLASIYGPYTYDPEGGGQPPASVDVEALQTDALNRAIAEGGDPDVGLGYDPYCACQDFWDVSYTIDEVALEGDEATALVLFSNAGGDAQRLFLLMRRTPAGWRVDDITDSNGSLRAALQD
jgi:hypothetical protein